VTAIADEPEEHQMPVTWIARRFALIRQRIQGITACPEHLPISCD
jgi:hypothetical protein